MSSNNGNSKSKKVKRPGRSKRRLLRFSIGLFLFLGLVQTSLYYFSDPFIREFLQEKVERESEGVYKLEFDRVNVNLAARGFTFTDLRIKPNDIFLDKINQDSVKTYYDVFFPEFEVSGIGLLTLYYDKLLHISSVEIDRPDIKFLGAQRMQGFNQHNKVYQDLYPSLNKYVDALIIDELKFSNGSIVLNNSALGRSGYSTAGDIYITLYGFKIDENAESDDFRLLFSDHINLDIEDYRLRLGDGIHVLEAEEVNLSTATSSIYGKKIWLLPYMASDSIKNDPNEEFYDVYIPEIQIDGADIYKAYFESIFDIDEVKLVDPEIRFITRRRLSDLEQNVVQKNLYTLSSAYLDEINVDSFSISNGKFAMAKDIDRAKNDLFAEKVSVSVSNFQVDSNSYGNQEKIFYADELKVNVGSYVMDLADSVHHLKADKVEFSTFDNRAIATSVQLRPKKNPASMDLDLIDELYDISVPQLVFEGVDFPELYNLRDLNFNRLMVNNPTVKITDHQRNQPRNRQLDEASLYRLIKNYLVSIDVDKIQLNDGSLEFAKYKGVKKDTIRAGKIAFTLDNFRLDSVGQYTSNRIFFADHIDFTLDDYLMRLSDDIHILRASRVGISTVKSEIYANNIELFPIPVRNIYRYLERYNRSVLYNVTIPSLSIKDADIRKAYFSQVLNIGSIDIGKPVFKLNRYADIETKQRRNNNPRNEDLYALFSDYLKSININKMRLNNGIFNVVTNTGGDANTLSQNNVSIEATNFILDESSSSRKDRILYSDDIEVNLDNYVLNLPDSIHVLKTGRLGISTAKSEIYLKSTHLYPISNRLDTVNLAAFYDVEVPDIVMKGVDIRKLYDNNILEINQINLINPNLQIINQIDIKGKNNFITARRQRSMPAELKGIKIKSARITNGKMAFSNLVDNRREVFSSTRMDLELRDFLMDSLILNNNRKILFADNVVVNLKDYSMYLPDSIHHIYADNIDVSSGLGKISAKNFRLMPKKNINYQQALERNNRKYLYDLTMPNIELTGIDLEKAYLQKNYTVRNATITKPKVVLTSYKQPETEGKRIDPKEILNQLLSKNLKFLNIQQLDFNQADFTLYRVNNPKHKTYRLFPVDGYVRNFNLNERSKNLDSRLFYADDINLKIKNYAYTLPDSLYTLTAKELGVSLARSRIVIDSLRLIPKFGKFEFGKKLGYEKDRATFVARKAEFLDFDFGKYILEDQLISDVVNLYDFRFENYRDKRLPDPLGKTELMPQQMIREMEQAVSIKDLNLYNGYVSYEEFHEEGQRPGKIEFTSVSAQMKNVTNIPSELKRNDLLRIDAKAMLMGRGRIQARLETRISDKSNSFSFTGNIDRMNLLAVNPMLENVAFISVKSGENDGLTFNLTGNNDLATGELKFRYTDLKVTVLKKETGDKGGLASFLANTFVINNKNPVGKNLRVGDIYFERDKQKSMFNFLWKSLLSGIKPSLGINDKSRKDRDDKASAK